MPKLLYIIQNSDVFVSHRLPIAQKALAEGWEVHLATHVFRHRESLEQQGIKVHHFPLVGNLPFGIREAWAALVLFIIFLRVRPRLIHAVAIRCILLGGLLARLLRVPHRLFAVAGVGYYFIDAKAEQSLFRKVLVFFLKFAINNKQSTTIYQNDDDLELCRTHGISLRFPTAMIRGSGVDLEQFFPGKKTDSDEVLIGLPARIQAHKGIHEYAAAAKLLKPIHKNARFILLGEIDYDNPTALAQEELETWEAQGLVETWGHQNDMPKILRKLDIACLPSYREGLPKALLEAAATGLPIVTTDVPGCRDVVEDGVEGFVVPVKNPKSLAEALSKLIASKSLRVQMGQAARHKAKDRFAISRIVEQHLAVYRKMIKG